MRPHQTALVLAALLSVVGMVIPPVGTALLPLRYLNTHLHELGHAIAALGTGGSLPEGIRVYSDGSGVTPVLGGFLPLVACAGYLGAAAAGAGLVLSVRSEKTAHLALSITGVALGLSMLLFVRHDAVGVISGWVWTALLLVGARLLRGPWLQFVVGLIGIQQGLNALRSLLELVQISAMSERQSDARLMQDATYVPAVVWATVWGAIGLWLTYVTLRRTWGPSRQASRPDGSPATDR